MASFRAGQKVRHRPSGYVGTFVRYCAPTLFGDDCEVRPDHAWLSSAGITHPAGVVGRCLAEQLDPITPPRREQVVSWESMPCDRNGRWRETVEVRP